jgi:hypothetical protein
MISEDSHQNLPTGKPRRSTSYGVHEHVKCIYTTWTIDVKDSHFSSLH